MEKLGFSNKFTALKAGFIVDELSNLLGQVLTVVDASTEGEKNLAMKSLIKEKFSDKQDFVVSLSYKQVEETGEGHMPRQYWEDGLVPCEGDKKYSFR